MILTVEAMEVTAGTGKRKTLGAWMEMIERLLLDGVDGQGTGQGVYLAKENTTIIATTTTTTCLAVGDMAVVRTKQALYLPVIQPFIIPTFFHLLRR